MRYHRLSLLAVILATIILVNGAMAQSSGDFNLGWHLNAGGGGSASSGNYIMNGSIGQPVTSGTGGTNFGLTTGFWQLMVVPAPPPSYIINLPVILRAPP